MGSKKKGGLIRLVKVTDDNISIEIDPRTD
jgi:hypothetical protein